MTWALCFNCGSIKFGAICPCPQCHVASTGDEMLDILFSTHHWQRRTLEEFGSVVQAIKATSGDRMLGFWAFIRHVSDTYPEILHVELEPEVRSRVDAILAGLLLPSVTLRHASGMGRGSRVKKAEPEARAGLSEAECMKAPIGGTTKRGGPWWRFWK
jgi:hypothetical protein